MQRHPELVSAAARFDHLTEPCAPGQLTSGLGRDRCDRCAASPQLAQQVDIQPLKLVNE